MTKDEAIECAKNMTYQEAIRNTIYAKGVKYKKATRIKLQELAEIADKIDAAEPSGDLISRDEVLALINKAMFSTANIDMQDYIFNGLRRDVHNLPSADRPTDEPETEPAPVIAYVCDRRRCAICSGEDGGCDHTTDIKHAAHFKNVAGQYMEEEEDNE